MEIVLALVNEIMHSGVEKIGSTKSMKLEPKRPYPPLRIGYARVSTEDQDLRQQIDALVRDGVLEADIYTDKKSGKNMQRVGLQSAMGRARPGDIIVVPSLDRLSRRLRDLIDVMEVFAAKGIELRSLRESLDTSTAVGRMMFQLVGVFAEFERALTSERTKKGLDARRASGKPWGPPQKMTAAQVQTAVRALKSGQPVTKIARRFRVTTNTLRARVLEVTAGKKLWPDGPRAKR